MSLFSQIDDQLNTLADKLQAKLSKDRPEYPEILRTFEERRIDWQEGPIRKAIIIQPTFRETGVDSSVWNLVNIAWSDSVSKERLKWKTDLVCEEKFEVIESNIHRLLTESENNLRNIGLADLRS